MHIHIAAGPASRSHAWLAISVAWALAIGLTLNASAATPGAGAANAAAAAVAANPTASPAVLPITTAPAAPAVPTAPTQTPAASGNADATAASPQPPTGAGQRIYERARPQLLQVRTLLKTQDSQSSVGSGFLVEDGTLLVSNYHVVSQYALQPSRHRLVYSTVDGQQGALELLAFDVVHDLALLRLAQPDALAGRGAVKLRPADEALPRGARIFSLGNPLDVGFAVAEGTFNGQVERSFLPTLFFGGSLSAGMSGGPALDDEGRLVGVNVAARRDGEQVSFLVPAEFVRNLVASGRSKAPIVAPAWAEITRQLLQHEANLSGRFLQLPWREAGHALYRIPVPQEQFMRCWGRGSPQAVRGLQFERSDCEMDSRVFVSGSLLTGFITVRHEAYDGSKLGALRFSQRYSDSFRNEFIGLDDRQRTAGQCLEQTVGAASRGGRAGPAGGPEASARSAAANGLPLRAVVCLRAYKKLEGLYDLSVLVATLDKSTAGVQGRFDAFGVSLPSAQRLTQHYLDGFAWKTLRNGPALPNATP